MSEEEVKDVNTQDAVAPETNSEDSKSQAQVESTASQEPAEGSKEYNFARIRQKNDELERQVNELIKRENERSKPAPEIDELDSLSNDDILTVEQAAKQAEKIVNKVLAQREMAELPIKTKAQFTDFDSVMTKENIKKLETEEPGLADACAKSSNPWEATYKILKKFILPQQDVKFNKNDEKMKENLSKPISSNAVGRGPLSNANNWSEASKDDLYKEMMESSRRG